EKGLRVAGPREVAGAGEDAERRGLRQVEVFEIDCDLAREDGPRGGAIDDDVLGRIRLEQRLVDGDRGIQSRGERMLRRQRIQYGDDLRLREVRHRDRLDE